MKNTSHSPQGNGEIQSLRDFAKQPGEVLLMAFTFAFMFVSLVAAVLHAAYIHHHSHYLPPVITTSTR